MSVGLGEYANNIAKDSRVSPTCVREKLSNTK